MTSVKISTTDELLAILPHQCGHHLADSVAILMVTDKIVGPIARTDIPPERDVKEVAADVLASLLRVEPQLAMLVGYESMAGESRSLMHALHAGLRRANVGIIDHVTVRDGRWWGWCCRPEDQLDGLKREHLDGHALADEAAVPAVAEFIARGSSPLPTRAAVGDLVTEDSSLSGGVGAELDRLWELLAHEVDPTGALEIHPEDVEEQGIADEIIDARARVAESIAQIDRAAEVWGRVLAPDGDRGDTFDVSDVDVARAVRSLANKPWRDALISWMSPVMFPLDQVDDASGALLAEVATAGPATTSERSKAALRRLLQLARRVPDEWANETAAICTVVACVAWGVGSGSTAGDALTRALGVQPEYVLAGYVSRMVEFQLRPRHEWSDVGAWPRAS